MLTAAGSKALAGPDHSDLAARLQICKETGRMPAGKEIPAGISA